MRSGSSLSRRGVLLIAIICPALLGSQVKCVFVSNPTVATARIERIEPKMPLVGEVVHMSGTGNGTPPLQFAWDFGDGTVVATGTQAAHAYLAPGSYHLTFTVRDANGNASRDAAQIDVAARLPIPTPNMIVISRAVAGQPVVFEALPRTETASAPGYVWTFSDGQTAVGPRAAAIFPLPGMYQAAVAVTNERGEIKVAQVTFHVAAAAR
jgi:hypothetical protein